MENIWTSKLVIGHDEMSSVTDNLFDDSFSVRSLLFQKRGKIFGC